MSDDTPLLHIPRDQRFCCGLRADQGQQAKTWDDVTCVPCARRALALWPNVNYVQRTAERLSKAP